MKNIIILSLVIFYAFLSCSPPYDSSSTNYFEGRITYKTEFVRKSNKYDSTTLSMAIGKFSDYFIKDGNSLIKNYGAISYETLYRVKENKIYSRKVWSDSVFYTDCSKPGFKILKFTITPNKETILGIKCDELKVFFDGKIVTNYFNSDTLRADPALHSEYTFYNEDFYSQKMRSISLKFIIEKPDYMVTYTATSFSYVKLSEDLFSIPKNKKLVEEN